MVSKEEDKMKITTDRLKEIIKEEIEVTLTNEEAAEMFGDEVLEGLDEMYDPSNINLENIQMVVQALSQMGANFAPIIPMIVGLKAPDAWQVLKREYDNLKGLQRDPTEDPFEDEEDPWAHPVPEM